MESTGQGQGLWLWLELKRSQVREKDPEACWRSMLGNMEGTLQGDFLSLGWVAEGESNPPAAPPASMSHDSGPTMRWEPLKGVVPSSPLVALSRTAKAPLRA